ncbi:MAG: hypothetical protein IIV91_01750, partial [Alistipes sp.]|nr:hypothetical protein [Alistipes sp.]
SEKGEGRVREIETHSGTWSDIGYARKQDTNFASEIELCDRVLAKPKHYVLRSEGLRALGNIEDINVDDLYGSFERKHDQFNQAEKDKPQSPLFSKGDLGDMSIQKTECTAFPSSNLGFSSRRKGWHQKCHPFRRIFRQCYGARDPKVPFFQKGIYLCSYRLLIV